MRATMPFSSHSNKQKPIFTLITQNVDGLHDLAGSKNVIKLHGDIWTVRCVKCGTERVEQARTETIFRLTANVEQCCDQASFGSVKCCPKA